MKDMRVYKNQDTGLTVTTGTIKSIADDRLSCVVTSETWDKSAKQTAEVDVTARSPIALEDKFKPGYRVTMVGYSHGKNLVDVDLITGSNEIFETPELAVVTGFVRSARLNPEKNEDGTTKFKADGVTPKKPHFDVSITVKDDDGKYINHVIKVYDYATEKGKKTPIERAQAAFKDFDAENNRIVATFVTQPGETRSWVSTKNGKEYVNYTCDHLGYRFMDLERVDERERTQDAPTKATAPTPAQTNYVAPAPAQAPVQPTPEQENEGTGFAYESTPEVEAEMFT